jgi:hypothetical protein
MSAFYEQGLYSGECVGQFTGTSSGGTPYFALKFKIIARIVSEQEVRVEQSERTVYMYLSDKAAPYTVEAIRHLGYDRDSLRFIDPNVDSFFNFAGIVTDLWCKVEDYQGDTKEKWSISTPRAPVEPLDDKEMRRLDALFGKALRGVVPSASAPTPPVAAPATEERKPQGVSPQQQRAAGTGRSDSSKPPTEDEIPF